MPSDEGRGVGHLRTILTDEYITGTPHEGS